MDNTKKTYRWLAQIQHCHDRANESTAQAEQTTSEAIRTHCQERLEFFAARDQVLTKRMLRLHRKLTQETAEASNGLALASKKLLDTIYAAVRQHGKVILTKKDDGGVQINVVCAENK